MLLEVCASNYQSAVNSQKSGAHRIELCEDLRIGGITPSDHLLKQVLIDLDIPVFVLVRPRGGDFNYSSEEFEQMKNTIINCKDLGCSGIVSGILNDDGTIDLDKTKTLIELSRPLPFTFHRAFDEINKPFIALEKLIKIGVTRILTSGQKSTAEKGIDLIRELNNTANNRITILPGAGINPENAKLFNNVGLKEIHASATGHGEVSKEETIKAILKSINE